MPNYNSGNQSGEKTGQGQQSGIGNKTGTSKSPAPKDTTQKGAPKWSKEKPMNQAKKS